MNEQHPPAAPPGLEAAPTIFRPRGPDDLRGKNLRKADLADLPWLLPEHLARSDLTGNRTVPPEIAKFPALGQVKEISAEARKIFIGLLAACVYSWLVIGTTTDKALILNTASSPFWGDGGIEWTQQQAAGWPHLVQLLAGTAVDLVNDDNVSAVSPAMLERAADRAIVDGDTVLRELMSGESRLPGEWDYLAGFRTRDEQAPPADEAIFQSLRRRQLVVEAGGLWRLRVPLMQRWLRARG